MSMTSLSVFPFGSKSLPPAAPPNLYGDSAFFNVWNKVEYSINVRIKPFFFIKFFLYIKFFSTLLQELPKPIKINLRLWLTEKQKTIPVQSQET